jgi:hypothetical protein
VALATLATDVVDDLAEHVREETVIPLACRLIECAVQGVLVNSLRVDYVGDALDAIQAL